MSQLVLNKTCDEPLYQQISKHFRGQIEKGELSPMDTLPPIAVLAKKCKVNFRTVRQAYQSLEDSGVVKFENGRAKVVFSHSRVIPSQTGGIAIVTHNPRIEDTSYLNDYAHGIFCSIVNEAGYNGYHVQSISLRDANGVSRLIGGSWAGIIFDFTSVAHTESIWFEKLTQIPKVFLASVFPDQVSVMGDDRQGIGLAIDHLYQYGHSKIAFIAGVMREVSSQLRFDGYLQKMQDYGLRIEPNWIVQYPDYFLEDEQEQERIFERMFGRGGRPTAVVSSGYYLILGLLKAFQRHGIRVPEDVSLIGYDDPASAPYLTPPLTTIRQPLKEIGLTAFNVLQKLIDHQKVESVYLPVELIVRKSTGPAPTRG